MKQFQIKQSIKKKGQGSLYRNRPDLSSYDIIGLETQTDRDDVR